MSNFPSAACAFAFEDNATISSSAASLPVTVIDMGWCGIQVPLISWNLACASCGAGERSMIWLKTSSTPSL